VVDSVAKAGAGDLLASCPLPHVIWRLLDSPLLPLAWLTGYQGACFPAFDQLLAGAYEPPDEVPEDLLPRATAPSVPTSVADLRLRLVTCNVQTLKDKRQLVFQQLLDRQVLIAGLQETRTTLETQCKGAVFAEFASAACNGEGGATLLFNTRVPYGWCRGRPLFLEPAHLTCLHAEAQLICVQVRAPFLQVVCVCAHAPHSGLSAQAVQKWWHSFSSAPWLQSHRGRVLAFLDANAQLGSTTSEGIGSHAADNETPAGAFLRDWADNMEVCLPATMHNGDGLCDPGAREPTWFSPSGVGYRIDFVGVPAQWGCHRCVPSTLVDFELLNRDHIPAQVEVRLRFSGRPDPARPTPLFPRDPQQWPAASLDGLRQAIEAIPCPEWGVSVHKHVDLVFQAIKEAGRRCQPPPRRRCRAFVSEPTRILLDRSKGCRSALRGLKQLHQALLYRRASARPAVSSEGWSCRDVASLRQWVADTLGHVQKQLRQALAVDKGNYVRQAQARLQDAHDPFNAKAFFAALRALRPPGKRVLKPFSKLVVDAEADDDPTQRLKRQQKHFADLEAGVIVEERLVLDGPDACTGVTGSFLPKHLPAWVDVETDFRKCKAGKAPGADALPDWVWKARYCDGTYDRRSSSSSPMIHYIREEYRNRFFKVCQILSQLGVAPASLHIVCKWLTDTDLMEHAHDHERALLQAYFTGSFFTMKEGGNVIRTRAGTRPGDSIADALFSLLQADFIAGVRHRFDCQGMLLDPVTKTAFQ
ncbi:unnamed protein product, partial [Symbiodinium sp. CCMP2456]